MNKENIPVITDREKLYDKCENMEQLFDKYYLPLLDKHYSKTYELQQENQKYKEVINKAIEYIENCNPNVELHSEFLDESYLSNYGAKELLDILKEVSE